MSVSLVFCTAPDEEVAQVIAKNLVEKSLAACVKILPKVKSVYRWEGNVEIDSECQLLIKTASDKVSEAEKVVSELHPYDVPEWLVVPDTTGSSAYVSWIIEQTR